MVSNINVETGGSRMIANSHDGTLLEKPMLIYGIGEKYFTAATEYVDRSSAKSGIMPNERTGLVEKK